MNRSTSSIIIAAIVLCLGLLTSAEYKLVWSDEFNGNKLDTSIWSYENHCAPQNNELQCYTNRDDNVYVKDGFLYVEAKPENYGNKKYTSGRINTKKSVAWKYGKFEVRAKLPKGDYLWPALWMLPRDYKYGGWAASGEIDIMEARGQFTNQVSNALHYGGAWPNNVHTGSGAMNFNTDFTSDFHLFSAIWEKDQIQFLVDNKVVSTQNLKRNFFSGKGKTPYTDIRQPFDQPFFFLINVAIGGNFFGGNSNSLTTATAQKWASPRMVVDYVRVYQENGSPVVNPVPVPSSQAQTTPKPSSQAQTTPKPSAETPKPSSQAQTTPKPSQATPAPTANDVCSGKCGGESCCADGKLGAVCYNANNYNCVADESNGKKTLCGKGLGSCSSVCYDSKNYKCTNGKITQK